MTFSPEELRNRMGQLEQLVESILSDLSKHAEQEPWWGFRAQLHDWSEQLRAIKKEDSGEKV